MTSPNHPLADAIRKVTASMQQAIEEGYRSRTIDADDLVEVLLAIADELDPPVRDSVDSRFACPDCGEVRLDALVWQDDQFVRCSTCGTIFSPGG